MASEDRMNNKAEELKGRAKQTMGEVTDDERLESEGRAQKSKGSLKQAAQKIKDAVRRK